MARGKRRTLTLEERLTKVTEDIIIKKQELENLEETKVQIEKDIKAKKLNEIYELVEKSGKSLDEVKELLSK